MEYIKEALEIVKAQASVRSMTEDEIISMARSLSGALSSLGEPTEANTTTIFHTDPATAIKEKSIICVICGKPFKVLTKKHLDSHGHNPASYRDLCGYKPNTALVCKTLQRERRKKMQAMRLWERRPAKGVD
jgi:predicted transcriptional regulator